MNLAATLNRLGPVRAFVVVLTLLFSIVWTITAVEYGVIPVRSGVIDRLGGPAAGDFEFFYSAAVVIHDGRAASVYDPVALTRRAREVLGPSVPSLVWPYPPTMSLVLWPLGAVAPHAALMIWIALLVCGLLVLGRVVTGTWRRAWIVFFFPGTGMVLFAGQFSAVLAPFLAGAFLNQRERPVLGGSMLGAFILKPQFAFAPTLYAMLRRRVAFVTASAAVALAAIVVSATCFGLSTWIAFYDLAFHHSESLTVEAPMSRFVSMFATAVTMGFPQTLALVIHVVALVAIGAVAYRLRMTGHRLSTQATAWVCAAILLSPYALDYDLIFMGLPWLLLVVEACTNPELAVATFWRWLALTWLVPVSYLAPYFEQRPIAGPLLGAYLLAVWAADRRSPRGS